jgi:hypothetical protein
MQDLFFAVVNSKQPRRSPGSGTSSHFDMNNQSDNGNVPGHRWRSQRIQADSPDRMERIHTVTCLACKYNNLVFLQTCYFVVVQTLPAAARVLGVDGK